MNLNLQIDCIDAKDVQLFQQQYFKKQKPVIIKGLLNGTEAGEKWDIDYIKQRLGHVDVMVFDNNINKTSAYTTGDIEMKFSDFIDIIIKDEPVTKRLFLFNGFKYCKDLSREFPCPKIFKGLLDKVGFMFFGGKDTTVRNHFDIDMSNVLHTQFVGKKRILLFSQEYNDLLYKTPLNTFSIADFQNIDYEKYPALKYVNGYDVQLEHGDSLFMPGGYWHYIVYKEGGFAVAYRKMAFGIKNQLKGIANLTINLWIDKSMNALFGKTWVSYKSKVAFRRANLATAKIEAQRTNNLKPEVQSKLTEEINQA